VLRDNFSGHYSIVDAMATSSADVFPFPIPSNQRSGQEVSQPFPFLIRSVRHQDLPSLAEVLARSFHTQDGPMGWMYPLMRMGIYEDLRQRLNSKSPRQVCLIAVPATRPIVSALSPQPLVGTVEVAQRQGLLWQFRHRHLYVSNLAVQADYRRQGIARQLLRACDRVAIEWKIPDLYLHVLENNYAARQLYAQAGYRLERTDVGIGSLLLGQPRQLFLHKRLSSS
jgi:ribosomal protein S18 acetylase RimI-like enzyme